MGLDYKQVINEYLTKNGLSQSQLAEEVAARLGKRYAGIQTKINRLSSGKQRRVDAITWDVIESVMRRESGTERSPAGLTSSSTNRGGRMYRLPGEKNFRAFKMIETPRDYDEGQVLIIREGEAELRVKVISKRHAYATYLAKAGVDPLIIARLLGHAQGVTGGYLHLGPEDLQVHVEKLPY